LDVGGGFFGGGSLPLLEKGREARESTCAEGEALAVPWPRNLKVEGGERVLEQTGAMDTNMS